MKIFYFFWNNFNGINGINVGFRGENGNKELELNVLKWSNVWVSYGDLIIIKYVDVFLGSFFIEYLFCEIFFGNNFYF